MNKPRLTFLALFLVSALLIAGCGGSDDESDSSSASTASASTGPLTKAEFIKRADEICEKEDRRQYFQAAGYREQHEKELNKLSPVGAEEKMIRIFVVPAIERQIEGIEELEPPKGDEQKIEEIVSELKKGLKAGEKKPYTLSYELPAEYPFIKLSLLAREYGFEVCSNPT